MTQRILIIGAGFAGMWSALSAVRLLDQTGREDIEIALIAPKQELHMRPRLYEPNPAAMITPLDDIFQKTGVTFIPGQVDDIDVVDQKASFTGTGAEQKRQTISYNRLILAAGSQIDRSSIPGLDTYTFNIDQVADAAKLEAHLHSLVNQPESTKRNTVVIAGAGFTGIEIAAEMPARLRSILGENTDIKIILVERAADIGPDLGPGPRPVIIEALTELGVTWKLGSGVAAVNANGVTLENGETIEADTVIWTTGMRASALTEKIPAERDHFGRLHVDHNLKVKGLDTVFATGDCAHAATDDEGNYAMLSCQHAMGSGRSAGHNATADLIGADLIPYRQPKYVTCLNLGPWGAVYTEGWDRQVKMSGAEAKALKIKINSELIYPPTGDRETLLAAADPRRPVV